MRTDLILDRLQKVKAAGTDKWQACCPAHDDKSPSLSIKQTTEGNTLLKCWAGCYTADICAAIGIELKDLFEGGQEIFKEYKPKQIDIRGEVHSVAERYSNKTRELLNG